MDWFQKAEQLVEQVLEQQAGGQGGGGFSIPALFNLRDSKTPGGPANPQTNFAVPIGQTPPRVDLRETGRLPPVYDQGQLGSCTANALAAAVHFDKGSVAPSRLFIYFNERTRENDVADDAGACLVDGCKSIEEQGVCDETVWPYSDDKEQFKVKPSDNAFQQAQYNKATSFENVLADPAHLKAALASGLPVAMGIKLYDSFQSQDVANTGRVPMPDMNSENCLGGHAVLMVGYDDQQQVWIMRNSWGEGWGDRGYFYLPYGYITEDNLATDCWIIKQMS